MANQEHLIVNISANTKGLQQGLEQAQGKLSAFSGKLKNIGSTLSKSVSLPLAIAGGAAIKMATDFNESLNKVDVAFGNSSNKVKDFAKTTLAQFGIAEGSALDMAALFGDMSTSMGLTQDTAANLSTSLVGLAGDLASFKNINIEQATTALAGVFTGETESLKRLGIVMTQANLQQFALNQGINKQVQDMSQAEKVLLRYNYVMSVTKNSQGDFERTQEGAANQMRIFSEGLKQLGSTIGQVMLPAFTKMVSFANDLVKSFINLSEPAKNVVVVIGLIATALPPLIWAVGSLTTAFASLNLVTGGILIGLGAVAVAIGSAVEYSTLKNQIDDLNGSLISLESNLKTVKGEFDGSAESSLKVLQAEKKLAEEKLKLAKANRDLKQGSIAEVIGYESDEVKALDAEIKKHTKTIENYDLAIKGLESSLSQTSQTTKELSGAITLDMLKFTDYIEPEKGKELANSFSDVVDVAKVFKDELAELDKFDPNRVTLAPEEIDLDGLDILLEKYEKLKESTKNLALAVGGVLTDAFTNLAEGGNFLEPIMKALKQLLIRLVAAAAAAAVLSALLPGNAVKSVGGAKGIFSLLSGLNIGEYANGGIISGPTLGLMGEYSGARSNPEVVAPLDKLQGMIGQTGQNVNVGGEFRIQGQDLVVALQRAERNRKRIL